MLLHESGQFVETAPDPLDDTLSQEVPEHFSRDAFFLQVAWARDTLPFQQCHGLLGEVTGSRVHCGT
jgi:hypothetical protein